MKTLSILIPVFNEIKNIEKCLDIVKKTHLKNFKKEIIISDNKSTDGTRDLLKILQKKTQTNAEKNKS